MNAGLRRGRGAEDGRIRVALIATVTHFGGMEQVLLTLLQHMDREVELFPVLFTRKDADQQAFFDHLERLDVAHVTYVNTRKQRYLNLVRNLWHALTLFRIQQFDLVHCHGYRADLLGWVVSKLFKLPVVTTVHGFTPTDGYLRLYKMLDLWALRRFHKVMAVSAHIKEDLVTYGGLDARRIDVITNAVASLRSGDSRQARGRIRAQLGIDDREFIFGFVGRLSEEKGVEYLLDAMHGLSIPGAHARVVVVGDGPQRQALEQRVRELALGDRILFAGFQSDPSSWYAAMDAFVLPSLTEGTPLALLEAMTHRLPVIASAVGGVPAIVDSGQNGLLVSPADPAELRQAMLAVAIDKELRLRLSDGGARLVRQQFDVQGWTRKVRELYVSAIQLAGAVS